MNKCITCRFFVPAPNESSKYDGECRRDTPTPLPSENCRGAWPRVRKEEGCGRHESRKPSGGESR